MSIPALVDTSKTQQGDPVSGPPSTTVSFEGKSPARVGDKTQHGETVTGPGSATVFIEGRALAFVGDATTASVKKNKTQFWGPGPLVDGAGTITAT